MRAHHRPLRDTKFDGEKIQRLRVSHVSGEFEFPQGLKSCFERLTARRSRALSNPIYDTETSKGSLALRDSQLNIDGLVLALAERHGNRSDLIAGAPSRGERILAVTLYLPGVTSLMT